MNFSTRDYSPSTSAAMRERQNETLALRLLIAQRRLYRRAKRWLAMRWIGMVLIGIGAPVVAVVWSNLAVVSGAAAGAWLFIGRTLLVLLQNRITSQAAAVQEQFDFHVFGMPDSAVRSALPSREDVSALAGPDDQIRTVAAKEKLLDWYPIANSDERTLSVAVSQRANASYTDRLLRATAIVWAAAVVVWIAVLIVLVFLFHLSLSGFLLGVALPVLPAFLDVVQYVAGVWQSAADRRDLALAIEGRITAPGDPISGEELLVWQERLFELRRASPEIPDFLYSIRRSINERAMHSAARQLGDGAKDSAG
ncbi:S-4TM family putative pore-forming effector [Mycolicibacterium porcinum]|uniref:S-4TM family putative pore-forming effector n=1 Tax=Mycolicibacterium porcinum TaxID=39693 RepID=UPI000848686A|nr:S-4TM family putative pore-forming effector [Mycolicibacterium porcinum]ODR25044.1 hypothetical protein BHQ19_14345 [Mycolicibacterium porcinum]